MRTLPWLIVVLVLTSTAIAGDAVDGIGGNIISSRPVLRVTPVRFQFFDREVWLNRLDSNTWKWLVDKGKDATIDKRFEANSKNFEWYWTLSNSGGGPDHHPDVVIQTDDHSVYEDIELNEAASISVAERRERKDAEPNGAPIKVAVPESNDAELKTLQKNCEAQVAEKYAQALDYQTSIMAYAEYQTTHAYVLLTRFKTQDAKPGWAVFRIQCTTGRVQTNLVRAFDDELIKGHTSYKIIPHFTYDRLSYSEMDKINLDTLELPLACTVDESVKK